MDKLIADRYITEKIHVIRGEKVMFDTDLAEMYGVETKVLNQAVKRNRERFPIDFMFQLNESEWKSLKSQLVTSNRGGRRVHPYAFTEQGVAMLSSVLNSQQAISVNIQIIRVFTRMRQMVFTQKDMLVKLEKLEKETLKNNQYLKKHEDEIQLIFKALKKLLNPEQPLRTPIGYKRKK